MLKQFNLVTLFSLYLVAFMLSFQLSASYGPAGSSRALCRTEGFPRVCAASQHAVLMPYLLFVVSAYPQSQSYYLSSVIYLLYAKVKAEFYFCLYWTEPYFSSSPHHYSTGIIKFSNCILQCDFKRLLSVVSELALLWHPNNEWK